MQNNKLASFLQSIILKLAYFNLISIICILSYSCLYAQENNNHSNKHLDNTKNITDLKYFNELKEIAKQRKLYTKRYWHLLVHYHPDFSGSGYSSTADGKGFFHSNVGQNNPEKELYATLRVFFNKTPLGNDHAICKFPARFLWLKEQLDFDRNRMPQPECTKQNDFIKQFDSESMSLVFASFTMDYASSLFGHTFFKFNKRRHSKEVQMDLTMSYGAMVPEIDPFRYILYAFIGKFPGTFEVLPYRKKILDYNEVENRNLWEYELNLNRNEIKRLVLHLWEMQNTHFDYYFNSENCSLMLLAMLEVARPAMNLQSQMSPIQKQSADVMKAVADEPNLLRRVIYRPANRTKYISKYKLLTYQERVILKNYIHNGSTSWQGLQPVRRKLFLNVAAEYLFLQLNIANEKEREKFEDKYKQTLSLMGDVNVLENLPGFAIKPDISNPYFGHKISQVTGSVGGGTKGAFSELKYSPTLREMIDASAGYSPYSELIFTSVTIRSWDKPANQIELYEFAFFKMISLNNSNALLDQISWNMEAGLRSSSYYHSNINKQQDKTKMNGYFEIGPGKAYRSLGYGFMDSFFFYAFLLVKGNASDQAGRIGVAFKPGILWRITDFWAFEASSESTQYTDNAGIISENISVGFNALILKDFAIQVKYKWSPHLETKEYQAGLKFYF